MNEDLQKLLDALRDFRIAMEDLREKQIELTTTLLTTSDTITRITKDHA